MPPMGASVQHLLTDITGFDITSQNNQFICFSHIVKMLAYSDYFINELFMGHN